MTSEVMQAALEPCPFCGSDQVATSDGFADFEDEPDWGAFCKMCEATVCRHTEVEAISAWNTRLTAQSGEGRSGAGEDAGPFHVSQSGDGKKLWFSARDPASGVTIPARDRTDARNLVSSLNHACATFAALNARQSGEGERDSAIDEIQSLRQRVERLEAALRIFLGGDDRFQVMVGGNPDAVEKMLEEARALVGSDGHGSHKGEDCYRCSKCDEYEYRIDR